MVAGWRGQRRELEAALVSAQEGALAVWTVWVGCPAYLFFLDLALGESFSKNHKQMKTPFALLLSVKFLPGNHVLHFTVREKRLPVAGTHSTSNDNQ